MPSLLDLPNELLLLLPQYIANVEDFNNAACSCRRLRELFNETHPNLILRLAASSAPVFFHPHPWFLVLATARQISDWAIGDSGRTQELMLAFRDGVDGLLKLALRVAGLTLPGIRRLYQARFDVINPLFNKIDAMIGEQWYKTPQFWNGGVSDAFTLNGDVEPITFQLLVYGELFGSTMRSFLEPEKKLPRFAPDVRIEYIKYCIPDWVNEHGGYPGFEVLPTGPYAPDCAERPPGNATALCHMLGGAMFRGNKWWRAWIRVVHRVAPDFEDDADAWRQKLYWDAVTKVGGLEGMEMVAKGVDEGAEVPAAWRERILEIRARVAALDPEKDRPGAVTYGTRRYMDVSNAPDLATEAYICCAGMWGGV